MDIHQELKELSKFLSEYSTSLMAVGVQTSRIVRNTSRIAESFGFFCDMTIFQKTIIMTLRDADNSHSYSTVNKIKPMGLNFAINSALSTLSWEAYDEHLSLTELQRRYHEIVSKPRESKWLVLILVAFANASFCRLFQGDFISMGIVFAATLTAADQLFSFSFAAIFRIISSESQYFGGTSVSKISDKEQPSS